MAAQVDYFITPVSPWMYLGHARFAQLVSKSGCTLRVLPVDYGAIFPVSGGLPLPKRAPQRQAYRLVELKRFSEELDVPMHVQPAYFPVSGDLASRLIIAVDMTDGPMVAMDLVGRIGRAIWSEQRNVADAATLAQVVAEAGLPADRLALAQTDAPAQRYAADTQEAIAKGVFGAPTYVVNGELFWGQDRLDFVAKRLGV